MRYALGAIRFKLYAIYGVYGVLEIALGKGLQTVIY